MHVFKSIKIKLTPKYQVFDTKTSFDLRLQTAPHWGRVTVIYQFGHEAMILSVSEYSH